MRLADLITAAVLMAVGGVVLGDAVRLGTGWGTDGPKSGFFPFWLAVITVVTASLIFLQALWRASSRPFISRAQLRPVLAVLWPAAVLVLLIGGVKLGETTLLPGIGLYVASGLYLAFYMRWVGRHDWRAVVALSVVVPVATFLIFERWFLVPMPKGPLEAWLGY
jgi:hypothetical protein